MKIDAVFATAIAESVSLLRGPSGLKMITLIACFCFCFACHVHAEGPLTSQVDIDQRLESIQTVFQVKPAPLCDDATFLRRLSLDLIGRVPSRQELDAFIQPPNRQREIDRLLNSPEHAAFWAQLWTTLWIGRREENLQRELLREWTERHLAEDTGMDRIAFRLITAQGVTALDGPANFWAANADEPVLRLGRAFLGVQMDCAQCHDHPFDRWTNRDYRQLKEFFRPLRIRQVSGGIEVIDEGAALVPHDEALDPAFRTEGATGQEIHPTFLTGKRPRTRGWRKELGLMVIRCKPFSRSVVNRVWYWLNGRALTPEVDAISGTQAKESPRAEDAPMYELLDDLAHEFRENGYQQRPLLRSICSSRAYQRATLREESTATKPTEDRGGDLLSCRVFAARNPRAMLPEQWFSSVRTVLRQSPLSMSELSRQTVEALGAPDRQPSGDPFEVRTTSQTVLRQLAGPITAPLDVPRTLFWIALGREPSDEEIQLVQRYRSTEILFALIHGNEFTTND